MATYYQSTNKFSPLAFVYFILACLFVLPIIAGIYTYAIWYIPIPYINMFITVGFGIAVAFVVKYLVGRFGKVRNPMVETLFGVVGAVVAMYWSWAIWLDLAMNVGEVIGSESMGVAVSNIRISEVLALASSPLDLYQLMKLVNEVGVWGFKGSPVTGTFLLVIWIIEALIVLFYGVFSGAGKSSEPFCEESNTWFNTNRVEGMLPIDNPQEFVTAIEENNTSYFDNLVYVTDTKKESHSIMKLYANETNENYLTVENNIASYNSKNELNFDSTELIRNIKISEEISNKIAASQAGSISSIEK